MEVKSNVLEMNFLIFDFGFRLVSLQSVFFVFFPLSNLHGDLAVPRFIQVFISHTTTAANVDHECPRSFSREALLYRVLSDFSTLK